MEGALTQIVLSYGPMLTVGLVQLALKHSGLFPHTIRLNLLVQCCTVHTGSNGHALLGCIHGGVILVTIGLTILKLRV